MRGQNRQISVGTPNRWRRWARFAGKPLLINGKSSIVVGTMDKLVPTLQTVKKAVLAGELDAALKASLDSRKRTLKQKATTTAAPAPKAGK